MNQCYISRSATNRNFAYNNIHSYYDKEYVTEFKTYKIESGIMSFFAQDANEIHFSGIADDKAPVVKVALGFDAHTDIDTYEYDKNEWNSVELNF